MLEKHQLLKSYSAIWRPHVFNNVIANYTDSAGEKFSVKYIPGYGLVKPGDIHTIVFQELR